MEKHELTDERFAKLTLHLPPWSFRSVQEVRLPGSDRAAERKRNVVERLRPRLKQSRWLAPRYEKRAESYLALVTRSAVLLWL